MSTFRFTAPLFAALLAAGSAPAAPGNWTAPRLSAPPRIDGRADDPAWNSLPWHGNFTLLNRPDTAAPVETSFKIAHDGRRLYLLVRCAEPEMPKLKCEITERDGKLWRDDSIELFLDVNAGQSEYRHFVFNANGAVYDAQWVQGGYLSSSAWDAPGTVAATSTGPQGWTLEAAIPFAELGLTRDSGGIFGFNLSRGRRGAVNADYSLMPLSGGFHQPTGFGKLKLENIDLADQLFSISAPIATRTAMRDDKLRYEGKLTFTNRTGRFRVCDVQFRIDGKEVSAGNIALDHTDWQDYAFSIPVPENHREYRLAVSVRDTGKDHMLSYAAFPAKVDFTPLTLTLTRPSYRNCIYADQKLTEIAGNVAAHLSAGELQGRELRIRLTAPGGDTVAETAVRAQAQAAFTLPIPQLPDGSYRLTAELNKAGETEHSAGLRLRKLPPFPGEVRLAENCVTLVDGRPFLPYGWFSMTDDAQLGRLAASGVNLGVEYAREDQKKALDRFLGTGIRAMVFCYPDHRMQAPDRVGLPLTDAEAQAIRKHVRTLRSHPALFAWYLSDEPDLNSVSVERLKQVRAICEEEDPYHPTVVLNNMASGIPEYIECADITNPDPYPMFLAGGDSAAPIDMVGTHAAIAFRSAAGRHGVWLTPQGFDYGDYGRLNNRVPDFDELRNMQYQCVLEGVTGFSWFSWHWAQPYPELMRGVDYLTREAHLLKAAILAPENRRPLDTGNPRLKAAWYPPRNGSPGFLIAVNNSVAPGSFGASLPGEWFEVGTGRPVPAQDGRLAAELGRYGVLVATTAREQAASLSLDECRRRIAADKARECKPGNLAFHRNGVKFRSSPPGGRSKTYPLRHVADGYLVPDGWSPDGKERPAWLELEFPAPVEAGRAELFGHGIVTARLVADPDGERRVLADFAPAGDGRWSANWKPETVSKLRLEISEPAHFKITEIEVYAK